MIRTLCYGNSNTWGFSPRNGSRLPPEKRWPRVLASELGEEYSIVEAGFNGRCVLDSSSYNSLLNGAESLERLLSENEPFDLVLVMLGTNDLFQNPDLPVHDITEGMGELVDIARKNYAGRNTTAAPQSKIILISPPQLNETCPQAEFFVTQVRKSKQLARAYAEIAREKNCLFFDAGTVAQASPVDGAHVDGENHICLGRGLARFIRRASWET